MATVQQIDDFVLEKYQKAEDITTQEERISDLNDIQDIVYLDLTEHKKNPSMGTYLLLESTPYNITLTDTVIKDEAYLSVNNQMNVIDDDVKIKFSEIGSHYYDNSYYYNATSETTLVIMKNGKLATDLITSGYVYIKYLFYKKPNTLTATTDTPNLDPDYHNLLKYKLIQRIASKGDNPDTVVANYWDAEYKELLKSIKEDSDSDKANNPIGTNETIVNVYGGWG